MPWVIIFGISCLIVAIIISVEVIWKRTYSYNEDLIDLSKCIDKQNINTSNLDISVVVINLKRRPDRLEFIKSQLNESKIKYTVFEAFDYSIISVNDDDSIISQDLRLRVDQKVLMNYATVKEQILNRVVSPGEVGCWLSHMHVYIRYVRGDFGDGPLLVLEDDALFKPNFVHALTSSFLKTCLPNYWEIIFYEHQGLQCHDPYLTPLRPWARIPDYITVNFFQKPAKESDVCKIKFITLTTAYLIRNRKVAKLLLFESNTEFAQKADHVWNTRLFPMGLVRAYAFLIPRVTQFRSTLGSDISSEYHFDGSGHFGEFS